MAVFHRASVWPRSRFSARGPGWPACPRGAWKCLRDIGAIDRSPRYRVSDRSDSVPVLIHGRRCSQSLGRAVPTGPAISTAWVEKPSEKVALSGTFWQLLERFRVPFRRAGSERRLNTNCRFAWFYANRTDLAQAILGSAKSGWYAHPGWWGKNRHVPAPRDGAGLTGHCDTNTVAFCPCDPHAEQFLVVQS